MKISTNHDGRPEAPMDSLVKFPQQRYQCCSSKDVFNNTCISILFDIFAQYIVRYGSRSSFSNTTETIPRVNWAKVWLTSWIGSRMDRMIHRKIPIGSGPIPVWSKQCIKCNEQLPLSKSLWNFSGLDVENWLLKQTFVKCPTIMSFESCETTSDYVLFILEVESGCSATYQRRQDALEVKTGATAHVESCQTSCNAAMQAQDPGS